MKYRHNRTGIEYLKLKSGKLKIDGKWIDCVFYISTVDGLWYARECNEFYEKFTSVKI